MFKLPGAARLLRIKECGQDLVEYAILGAIIATACVVSISPLAVGISAIFGTISSTV
jgi:Flp pilus assembly pilin Flp